MAKRCEWCEKSMASCNYQRHLKTCVYKNLIDLTKSEVELLKKKKPREDKNQEVSFMELKHFLTECYQKSVTLYKNIIVEDGRDPVEKIKEMRVSDSTKENYLQEWRLYNKWLKTNQRTVSSETANSYIASLKCRASTQRNKHGILQNILQHLVDRNIRLNRFKMRIPYVPKCPLSHEELKKYLEEQKNINEEDYIIQRLMSSYGLRINTIALLKIQDLEFLIAEDEDHLIHLPDSKVKSHRMEPIDPELEELLTDYVGEDLSDDDYIFYREGNTLEWRIRTRHLCLRINKRIKESKVIKKKPNYKYSSHMFRKTKAFNMFNQGVSELKEKVRASIGQSQGSGAVENYITHLKNFYQINQICIL